jgi:hypothetical protein
MSGVFIVVRVRSQTMCSRASLLLTFGATNFHGLRLHSRVVNFIVVIVSVLLHVLNRLVSPLHKRGMKRDRISDRVPLMLPDFSEATTRSGTLGPYCPLAATRTNSARCIRLGSL